MLTRRLAATLSFALLNPALLHAQQGRVGTIVVAHGGSVEWNGHVRAVAKQVNTGGPVEVSFLMGPEAATTRFQDAATNLERAGVQSIVVVPLLVSSHSEHYQQVRFLAGLTDSINHALHAMMGHAKLEPVKIKVPISVSRSLDDSPVMAQVLAERALALAAAPSRQALFLVGHGPTTAEDYAHWMSNLRTVADTVRKRTAFADVRVDLVRDDAPPHVRAEAVRRVRELIEMQHRITKDTVVVVPVLVSKGRVNRETFMKDLEGLPIVYTGEPLLPHTGLARWVEQRVAESRKSASATPESR